MLRSRVCHRQGAPHIRLATIFNTQQYKNESLVTESADSSARCVTVHDVTILLRMDALRYS